MAFLRLVHYLFERFFFSFFSFLFISSFFDGNRKFTDNSQKTKATAPYWICIMSGAHSVYTIPFFALCRINDCVLLKYYYCVHHCVATQHLKIGAEITNCDRTETKVVDCTRKIHNIDARGRISFGWETYTQLIIIVMNVLSRNGIFRHRRCSFFFQILWMMCVSLQYLISKFSIMQLEGPFFVFFLSRFFFCEFCFCTKRKMKVFSK